VAWRAEATLPRPRLRSIGGFAPTGSGGRRGPVTAGCPGPVNKHAHDGTHKCRSHRDQGVCQPVMSPVTPLKVWAAGPNRTTSAGGPGGGRGRDGRRQGGGQPGQQAGETADGADGMGRPAFSGQLN
jgi:hypothetical protein